MQQDQIERIQNKKESEEIIAEIVKRFKRLSLEKKTEVFEHAVEHMYAYCKGDFGHSATMYDMRDLLKMVTKSPK